MNQASSSEAAPGGFDQAFQRRQKELAVTEEKKEDQKVDMADHMVLVSPIPASIMPEADRALIKDSDLHLTNAHEFLQGAAKGAGKDAKGKGKGKGKDNYGKNKGWNKYANGGNQSQMPELIYKSDEYKNKFSCLLLEQVTQYCEHFEQPKLCQAGALHILSYLINKYFHRVEKAICNRRCWAHVWEVLEFMVAEGIPCNSRIFCMACSAYERYKPDAADAQKYYETMTRQHYSQFTSPSDGYFNAHSDAAIVRVMCLIGYMDAAADLVNARRTAYKVGSHNFDYRFLLYQALLDYAAVHNPDSAVEAKVREWIDEDGVDGVDDIRTQSMVKRDRSKQKYYVGCTSHGTHSRHRSQNQSGFQNGKGNNGEKGQWNAQQSSGAIAPYNGGGAKGAQQWGGDFNGKGQQQWGQQANNYGAKGGQQQWGAQPASSGATDSADNAAGGGHMALPGNKGAMPAYQKGADAMKGSGKDFGKNWDQQSYKGQQQWSQPPQQLSQQPPQAAAPPAQEPWAV